MKLYNAFKTSLIAVIGIGCLVYPSSISKDRGITEVNQQQEEVIEEKKTFPVKID